MQVWPHGGQKRYEAMERNWCRKGRQRDKKGTWWRCAKIPYVKRERGEEDMMWHVLWGEDAGAFTWEDGGELIWCCSSGGTTTIYFTGLVSATLAVTE